MIFSLDTSETSEKSFSRVQTLRNLCDNVIIVKAYCASGSEIMKCLLDLVDPSSNCHDQFRTVAVRLVGFSESAVVLQERIRNALDLVGSSLARKLHSNLHRSGMR